MRVHFDIDQCMHAYCRQCTCLWEPFDVADLSIPQDRFSTFKAPCDNCAFRPGSPERLDPQKWDDLMIKIHVGEAVFHCHKGVPLADADDPGNSHDHFTNEDGQIDMSKLRVCAGYLAIRLGSFRKGKVKA